MVPPLEMVVVGGGVVVDTGERVVVEAGIIYNYFNNTMIHLQYLLTHLLHLLSPSHLQLPRQKSQSINRKFVNLCGA